MLVNKLDLVKTEKVESTISLVNNCVASYANWPFSSLVIPEAPIINKLAALDNSLNKLTETSPLIPVVNVENNLVSNVMPFSSAVQLNKILANKELL